MKTITRLLFLLISVAVIVAGVMLYFRFRDADAGKISLQEAKVAEIRTMSDLCTLEIYEDVPVKGHIGTKHFFARQTRKGQIMFPLDSLDIDMEADTIRIKLPKEKVEILESTDPSSFEVIDTWNTDLLGSSVLTNSEESYLKDQARKAAIKSLYTDGTIKRARREASSRLTDFIGMITGKPVVVCEK